MNKINDQIKNSRWLSEFIDELIYESPMLNFKYMDEEDTNLRVLILHTEKYPIFNDYLEKHFKNNDYYLSQYLRYACLKYVKGLTSIKTIELFLKIGNPDNIFEDCSNLLPVIFEKETKLSNNKRSYFGEKYKIIGDLFFSHGFKPEYYIFYVECIDFGPCWIEERHKNFIDYCIQNIPKNNIKKIIKDIINDKDLLYEQEYKEYLLNSFFKTYPRLLMKMLKKKFLC